MATVIQKPTIIVSTDINKNQEINITNDENNITIEEKHHDKEDIITTNSDPIIACEALRQQNNALRQELHDIRQEMDEITDQFRTEDAEEFKQLQAELEVAAKNCRILQFKLQKIQQIIRDNNRARDFDEELLIAKEVSVRLHSELEKSEESRLITEKLNLALKQNLDTLKESLDQQLIKVNKF
ncbi:unnamed protein product [Rotaria sp. Silwood2]|nr:unnamed protein product [Rotaria sp. Silwood2]